MLFRHLAFPRRCQGSVYVGFAQTRTRRVSWLVTAFFLLVLLALSLALVPQAQSTPRIGLSASKTSYVENISVQFDTDFLLYALVTGGTSGEPMNQPVSSLPWVIHQVCCGAVLEIQDIKWNPDMEHVGHPLAGTVSSVETCLDQDTIWLATLTVRMLSTQAEDLLWASGPFGPIQDCNGEVPFFMNMPVTIALDGEPTPTDTSRWGNIKAMYR